MHTLYPLKFTPIFKEKIWGGRALKRLLGKDFAPLPNCGESWELSGLPGHISRVSNGFLEGNELPELIEVYMGDLVGDAVYDRYGTSFPLLCKFLDTADDLSIQVHPGDDIAFARHQGQGKAEMWYVIDAEPEARLFLGFREDMTPGGFRGHLENKTLPDILRSYEVKAGDVFYIPPGEVHAIGKGIRLCEIQQASDITYRIYDWDRPGVDGNPRKLHVEEALEAIDFSAKDNKITYETQPNRPVELVKSPKFTTRLLAFDQKVRQDYMFVDSFVVYVCLRGSFTIDYLTGSEPVFAGDTVLIPAEINDLSLIPGDHCLLLETYLAL